MQKPVVFHLNGIFQLLAGGNKMFQETCELAQPYS